MPPDPVQQQKLVEVLLQYIRDGKYLELVIFWALVYLPLGPSVWRNWRNRREVKALYKAQLADKDAEIKRQAERIKDLENASLKTRRK